MAAAAAINLKKLQEVKLRGAVEVPCESCKLREGRKCHQLFLLKMDFELELNGTWHAGAGLDEERQELASEVMGSMSARWRLETGGDPKKSIGALSSWLRDHPVEEPVDPNAVVQEPPANPQEPPANSNFRLPRLLSIVAAYNTRIFQLIERSQPQMLVEARMELKRQDAEKKAAAKAAAKAKKEAAEAAKKALEARGRKRTRERGPRQNSTSRVTTPRRPRNTTPVEAPAPAVPVPATPPTRPAAATPKAPKKVPKKAAQAAPARKRVLFPAAPAAPPAPLGQAANPAQGVPARADPTRANPAQANPAQPLRIIMTRARTRAAALAASLRPAVEPRVEAPTEQRPAAAKAPAKKSSKKTRPQQQPAVPDPAPGLAPAAVPAVLPAPQPAPGLNSSQTPNTWRQPLELESDTSESSDSSDTSDTSDSSDTSSDTSRLEEDTSKSEQDSEDTSESEEEDETNEPMKRKVVLKKAVLLASCSISGPAPVSEQEGPCASTSAPSKRKHSSAAAEKSDEESESKSRRTAASSHGASTSAPSKRKHSSAAAAEKSDEESESKSRRTAASSHGASTSAPSKRKHSSAAAAEKSDEESESKSRRTAASSHGASTSAPSTQKRKSSADAQKEPSEKRQKTAASSSSSSASVASEMDNSAPVAVVSSASSGLDAKFWNQFLESSASSSVAQAVPEEVSFFAWPLGKNSACSVGPEAQIPSSGVETEGQRFLDKIEAIFDSSMDELKERLTSFYEVFTERAQTKSGTDVRADEAHKQVAFTYAPFVLEPGPDTSLPNHEYVPAWCKAMAQRDSQLQGAKLFMNAPRSAEVLAEVARVGLKSIAGCFEGQAACVKKKLAAVYLQADQSGPSTSADRFKSTSGFLRKPQPSTSMPLVEFLSTFWTDLQEYMADEEEDSEFGSNLWKEFMAQDPADWEVDSDQSGGEASIEQPWEEWDEPGWMTD